MSLPGGLGCFRAPGGGPCVRSRRFPVPMIVQHNPPGFIRKEIPKDSPDGRSLADWTFGELFDAGIHVVNAWSVFAIPYEVTRRRLVQLRTAVRAVGSSATPTEAGTRS